MNRRTKQVAHAIRDELADIARRELHDPRLERVGFVTFSEVMLSPDHRDATVFVSFMGKEEDSTEVKDALTALASASSFIHRSLMKRLHIKIIPRLRFKYDRGFDRAVALAPAFQKIEDEKK